MCPTPHRALQPRVPCNSPPCWADGEGRAVGAAGHSRLCLPSTWCGPSRVSPRHSERIRRSRSLGRPPHILNLTSFQRQAPVPTPGPDPPRCRDGGSRLGRERGRVQEPWGSPSPCGTRSWRPWGLHSLHLPGKVYTPTSRRVMRRVPPCPLSPKVVALQAVRGPEGARRGLGLGLGHRASRWSMATTPPAPAPTPGMVSQRGVLDRPRPELRSRGGGT